MYHEMTSAMRIQRRNRRILAVCIVAVVIVLCIFISIQISIGMRDQAAASIRNSIINSAKQCAAIEGAYPPSLEYLEENYGLRVNEDDFLITYDVFAENLMPTVLVLPR